MSLVSSLSLDPHRHDQVEGLTDVLVDLKFLQHFEVRLKHVVLLDWDTHYVAITTGPLVTVTTVVVSRLAEYQHRQSDCGTAFYGVACGIMPQQPAAAVLSFARLP